MNRSRYLRRLARIPGVVPAVALLAAFHLSAAPPAGYELAWADEFEGTALDPAKWNHRQPGPRRDAINTPDAVTVKDGILTITTWTEGGKHYTGMISTAGLFESGPGYYEARVRFADAPGMWSAWWLQTPTMGRPLGDPAKAGMEIDLFEHRAVNQAGKDIADQVQHTLHWDGYGEHHKSRGHLTPPLGLRQGWHVFGCEWTETEYRFYVDGRLTWRSGPVSLRPEFMILSSEVHDGRWAGRVPEGGYGSRASSRTRFEVDYVRYYRPAGARKAADAQP
ncbi:MAG: glycosyl hydrolase family protein [Verrucomicrobia bacterium]|nr:MAG: glycosyl hydrolase family protein [Verrucomicrobiota bacterium]